MPEPQPDDIVTADTILLALRSTFRPEAARGLRAGYELRLGEIVVHARVDDGALEVEEGTLPDADLVLETDVSFHPLLTGELGHAEAIESGRVRVVRGKRELFDRFVEVFHIPPVSGPLRPEPSAAASSLRSVGQVDHAVLVRLTGRE